jgi:HrpA-like RNA helicase
LVSQLPQFILDYAIDSGRGGACRMICTQPRRISATALAARVASERCENVGEMVGYAIRGETVKGRDTRLLFCTTGVLLRMLQRFYN